MKQSPQIKARIDAIAKELANGKDRGEIVSKYVKKYQTNARTIDRYIKSAKVIASKLSNKANKAMDDVYVGGKVEAAKNGLKSVLEIDIKLQEIIFNNHKLIKDGTRVIKVENTTADQLKAMDIYYKRNGHYAPMKAALTDTDGNDIIFNLDDKFKK